GEPGALVDDHELLAVARERHEARAERLVDLFVERPVRDHHAEPGSHAGGRSTANWSVIAISREEKRKSAAGRPPVRPDSRCPPVGSSTPRRTSTRCRFVAETSCPSAAT